MQINPELWPRLSPLLDKALDSMNDVAGFQPDPVYAEFLQLAGNAYRQLGRAAEAKAGLEKACAMYTSTLGASR